jgi:uncharacterized membrane protein
MKATRLEAFSDGVMAIIITIMVLELKVPAEHSLHGLGEIAPTFSSYVLSFLMVAIYWVNHHHLIHLARRVNAAVLWANMLLLFCLSLVPFVTAFLGESHASRLSVVLYGALMLVCAAVYYLLRSVIARQTRDDARLNHMHECMLKKNRIAIGMFAASVPLALVSTWLALGLIAIPHLMYFIPDREVEKLIGE